MKQLWSAMVYVQVRADTREEALDRARTMCLEANLPDKMPSEGVYYGYTAIKVGVDKDAH